MLRKIVYNKGFQIIFSFAIAIALWCFVVINSNPVYTTNLTINNVEYKGMEELVNKGFYIMGELPSSADIRVSGVRNLVTKATYDYSALLDFSKITTAGEYSVRMQVNVPSGVTIKKIRPENVSIKVDKSKKTDIDTQLTVTGKKAEDYEINLIDKKISVSGPESIVDKIDKFEIYVDTDNIKNEGKVSYSVIPVGIDGKELSNENLTYKNEAMVEIQSIKTVDVKFDSSVIPESVTSLYDVGVSLSKTSIRIKGEKEVLDAVKEILVDTSGIVYDYKQAAQSVAAKLVLPDGVNLTSDESDEITVTFKYVKHEGQ
ncbi:MAG: CdaR family protein [Bacillota bacterium]|nr:CdaR family protein [Bacillota bacterium]